MIETKTKVTMVSGAVYEVYLNARSLQEIVEELMRDEFYILYDEHRRETLLKTSNIESIQIL